MIQSKKWKNAIAGAFVKHARVRKNSAVIADVESMRISDIAAWKAKVSHDFD